ncbi:MAG TPA: hypothetical protein VFS20_00365, partial [Longimicrobium sp.]|nr:hypothetical protein [Longimicrobium sp.]
GPTEALHRALIREWGWLEPVLSDPLCGARGYVDRQAFSTALVRARHGLVSNSTQLLRTISLELWLRTLTPRSRPALEGDARDVRLAATP